MDETLNMQATVMYDYDPDTGVTICTIYDNIGNKYEGRAKCHEQDMDMKSEKVGYNLAYLRAYIKILKVCRDDAAIALQSLNTLYYSMKHSTHFNKKSYENKMLQRQIRMREQDLKDMRQAINFTRNTITNYIAKKEEFYQKLRSNRQKEQ